MAHGAPVIAAWEIDELPIEWVEAMIAFVDELPEMQKASKVLEQSRREWRKQHPSYRKYRMN